MSDRSDFLHPDYEPGEFDQVERRLRQAMTRDVQQVIPSHRLDTILREAHEAGPVTATGGSSARRWMVPLAAAAAVAAIIGGVWWSGQDDGPTITPPQTSAPSLSPSPSPSESPTGSATTTGSSPTSPSTSATTGGGVATESVSLPVYFVGPVGDDKPTYKLFRDFIRSDLPGGQSPEAKVKAALVLAVNAQPFTNTDGYLQPWSGQTIGDVGVTRDLITIDLANAGNPGAAVTSEIQRLAVQELVWTATAAAQSNVPVRFTVRGQEASLFGSLPTDRSYTRPASDQLYEDVAPIWITAPGRDQVLPAAKPVVVTGQAIVFEANVSWQLSRGSTQVKTGHATASAGAPMQGTYSIDLGKLAAGSYTISVRELSAKNGSVSAEKSVSFTVK
jgi:hypothetical protein